MKFSDVSSIWLSRHTADLSYVYATEITHIVERLNCYLGNMDISNIKPLHIEQIIFEYFTRNLYTHKPSSKRTLKMILQTARSIFDYAIDNDFVFRNPACRVKIPKRAVTVERRALIDNEQKLILMTDDKAKTAAWIMMFCGLRRGEIIPLDWNSIDFQTRTLTIDKSVSQISSNVFIIKNGTKNGKSRIVTVPRFVIEHLEEVKKRNKSQFVISQSSGAMHTPSSFRSMWKTYEFSLNYTAYARQGGIRNKYDPQGIPQIIEHITPHMLRHTYATLLYTAGVDMKTAQQLLGHSSEEITLKIYTHLQEEKRKFSIEQFENFVENKFL